MQTVIPDLHASAPVALSFAPSTHVRAFLLRRRQGNLLIYSAETVADDVRAIEDLGGIARHYLNHWHEAAFGGGERIASTFGAPLFCHEDDRQPAAETVAIAGTFSERHKDGDDFEAVPIPGTRAGRPPTYGTAAGIAACSPATASICARANGSRRCSSSSDREAYVESLELIKQLDFDLLVPWAATAGQPCHALTDKTDTQRRIDAILERVRRGDDH